MIVIQLPDGSQLSLQIAVANNKPKTHICWRKSAGAMWEVYPEQFVRQNGWSYVEDAVYERSEREKNERAVAEAVARRMMLMDGES